MPEVNSDTRQPEIKELVLTEELITVTSFSLGQCRQSEKEKMEQKAISKWFKFEEPLLQEIPGEFIYWAVFPFRTYFKICTWKTILFMDSWPDGTCTESG